MCARQCNLPSSSSSSERASSANDELSVEGDAKPVVWSGMK